MTRGIVVWVLVFMHAQESMYVKSVLKLSKNTMALFLSSLLSLLSLLPPPPLCVCVSLSLYRCVYTLSSPETHSDLLKQKVILNRKQYLSIVTRLC